MFNGKQFMERSIVVNEAKPMEKREAVSEKAAEGQRGQILIPCVPASVMF